MIIPNRELKIRFDCIGFNKVFKKIKKLEIALTKLDKATEKSTKAMNELKDAIPIELYVSNGENENE